MDYKEDAFRSILDVMAGREGEIVSSALIRKEAGLESNTPIKKLITLGELTLVWTQQSGRVILNKSVNLDGGKRKTLSNGTWKAYIALDYEERYHSGLFESKGAAKEFLRQIAGDTVDRLEKVPGLKNVHAAETDGFGGYGTHTVVVRGEQINERLPLKE